jgi:RNA polymerase sigma factor for flagellar operon FliA
MDYLSALINVDSDAVATDSIAIHTHDSAAEREGRDRIILDNLSLVEEVVRRMSRKLPAAADQRELVSAGILGLIEAAARFDHKRTVKFRTYAETRVRGAILDHLRSLTWAPRGLHQRARAISAARAAVEQRKCAAAMGSEIADELGLSNDDFNRLLADVNRLNISDLNDEPSVEKSVQHSGSLVDPILSFERQEKLDLIAEATEQLPERLRVVLWLYYCEELTLKELGAVLKVNEARASQLHSKAIAAVRQEIAKRLNGSPARASQSERATPAGRASRQSPRRGRAQAATGQRESQECSGSVLPG